MLRSGIDSYLNPELSGQIMSFRYTNEMSYININQTYHKKTTKNLPHITST